ncbi:homeobox protein PKNOX2 isoform X2 [Frankliniella occidentalis]|uniref:Homeobox protein PKNOX2 isoform X2 n=1 Tax=Frankliniella occidentalis TaxID=133901 RepID=A0A6J1SRB1_FRAOC|nr:homeobox protein PKNOX2 isoform X2 [Frankliniella occidentalis]
MMQEGSVMVTQGYDQAVAAGPVVVAGAGGPDYQPDQAQFEADKRAVYKHPLFPLLALLFERCEQATQSAECPNSDSFNMDIQAFVQHQERDRKPFLMDDPEVDGLMIKAIQVLRIHLLELEKVQELCKDFCNRYITCLKGKMQSENLLRSDYASSYEHNNNNNSCHSSESSSPPGQLPSYPTSPHAGHLTPASPHHVQVVSSTGGGGCGGGAGAASPQLQQQQQQQQPQQRFLGHAGVAGAAGPGCGDLLGGVGVGVAPVGCLPAGGGYNVVLSPATPPAAPVPASVPGSPGVPLGCGALSVPPSSPSPGLIHGSTPLSQIGAHPFPTPAESSMLQGALSPSPTSPGSGDDDDDFLGRGKKQKRGVLPKHATSIMRSWLFQHLVHPYPTEDEKRTIAAQTNLTLLQVNNWFINARRRILQPMLDASSSTDTTAATNNGGSKSSANKKSKVGRENASSALTQRFWSENMGLPHLLVQDHNESSLMSSGGDDSDGEGEASWSQEEDDDDEDGADENNGDLISNRSHHRLKPEPSSDSEQ